MNSADSPIIVGTAGHIDHGKTTLVGALTGVDCDRLDEEKQRGITIVLGFAPLALPSGRPAAVVDVPGHERFVRTMVAGAGGIDLALLVVSAEEGVMPQTREHLEILRMLGVPELVVALTRADLVDAEFLELAELDVRSLLEQSPWPEAPLLPCSGLTGEGVDAIRLALDAAADRLPERPISHFFRLPVDRSFSIKGFGTVVTGTTRDGHMDGKNASLEVLPGRVPVRVRGVQVHGEAKNEVGRGMRVAINLQGVEPSAVPPGAWLATPGALACSDRIDVCFDLLAGAPWPLENNATVRLLYGTAEVLATVRLLDPAGGPAPKQIESGSRGWAQLALREELASAAGDRFVLRTESPMWTLGGGRILDPEPPLLRRRARGEAAHSLRLLEDPNTSGADRVVALLRRSPEEPLSRDALRRRLPLVGARVEGVAAEAVAEGRAVALATDPVSWAWTGIVERWVEPASLTVDAYHRGHPLLDGPLRNELRQALVPPPPERMFDALLPRLCSAADLEQRGHRIGHSGHDPEPSEEVRGCLDHLVARFEEGGVHPPPAEYAIEGLELPADALSWLVDQGELIRVAEDFYVARTPFRGLVRRIVEHLDREGVLSPQDFKAISGLSRRHAIPFLEYFDRARITSRTPAGRALRDPPTWAQKA